MSNDVPIASIRTVEDARAWIEEVQVCTIFEDRSGKLPSLWEVTDAPDKQPGEGGWGKRMELVWRWKNELPARYPDEIYYGKLKGGRAILCTFDYLGMVYPVQRRSLDDVSETARDLYSVIEEGPIPSRPLRQAVGLDDKAGKARFERALQELQVAMLIVRVNHIVEGNDTWTTFEAQYPDWEPA